MIGLDTNVPVRYFVQDDASQSRNTFDRKADAELAGMKAPDFR
jgi:predicted nucleic-acid-binding protein